MINDYQKIFKIEASSEENEYVVKKKISRWQQSTIIGNVQIFSGDYPHAIFTIYSSLAPDEFDYLCAEIMRLL